MLVLTVFLALVSSIHADDGGVLLDFKGKVGDSSGGLNTWNSSNSLCEWNGIRCSGGRVTGVHIESLQSLSPSLLFATVQQLPHLRILHVSSSAFTDVLAKVAVENCSLEVMDLSGNNLNGTFPYELMNSCSSLRSLNLSHNLLTGDLQPGVVTNTLEDIDISSNMFTGEVASSLFMNCPRLRRLDLSYNNLTGEMNVSCGLLEELSVRNNNVSAATVLVCSSLTHLDVSSNLISTTIFATSVVCPSLKVLNVSTNSFTGPFFVANLSSVLPSLEILDASFNSFTGSIPVIHHNLRHLNLSSNAFTNYTGRTCSSRGISKLESIILPNNKLAGRFLDTLQDCTNLKMLDLTFNEVGGEIPDDICDNLPGLECILAMGNNIRGNIPPNIGRCTNMTVVFLSYNFLEGQIPQEIGELNKLWSLSLSTNLMNGGIPASLGNLTSVQSLQLSNNSFDGELPAELRNCKSLVSIEVRNNSLTGRLPGRVGLSSPEMLNQGNGPVQSLRIVQVTSNQCKGLDRDFLVQGIRLQDFQRLLVSRTGCDSTLNFNPSFSLRVTSPMLLDYSGNQISGEIPPEIADMDNLYSLDVSHNLLTGRIPRSFGRFKNIDTLNLSHNLLEGSIPVTLSSLTTMELFDVSYNNLSGGIPQTGQLITFPSNSFEGNKELCGLPLAKVCSDSTNGGKLVEDGDDLDIVLVSSLVFGSIVFVVSCLVTLYWEWERPLLSFLRLYIY